MIYTPAFVSSLIRPWCYESSRSAYFNCQEYTQNPAPMCKSWAVILGRPIYSQTLIYEEKYIDFVWNGTEAGQRREIIMKREVPVINE